MIKKKITVSGIVQGVTFRKHLMVMALALNVNGYAKNLPDGKLEAVFIGKKENVDKLLDFCKKGPLFASVRKYEISNFNGKQKIKGFSMKWKY